MDTSDRLGTGRHPPRYLLLLRRRTMRRLRPLLQLQPQPKLLRTRRTERRAEATRLQLRLRDPARSRGWPVHRPRRTSSTMRRMATSSTSTRTARSSKQASTTGTSSSSSSLWPLRRTDTTSTSRTATVWSKVAINRSRCRVTSPIRRRLSGTRQAGVMKTMAKASSARSAR